MPHIHRIERNISYEHFSLCFVPYFWLFRNNVHERLIWPTIVFHRRPSQDFSIHLFCSVRNRFFRVSHFSQYRICSESFSAFRFSSLFIWKRTFRVAYLIEENTINEDAIKGFFAFVSSTWKDSKRVACMIKHHVLIEDSRWICSIFLLDWEEIGLLAYFSIHHRADDNRSLVVFSSSLFIEKQNKQVHHLVRDYVCSEDLQNSALHFSDSFQIIHERCWSVRRSHLKWNDPIIDLFIWSFISKQELIMNWCYRWSHDVWIPMITLLFTFSVHMEVTLQVNCFFEHWMINENLLSLSSSTMFSPSEHILSSFAVSLDITSSMNEYLIMILSIYFYSSKENFRESINWLNSRYSLNVVDKHPIHFYFRSMRKVAVRSLPFRLDDRWKCLIILLINYFYTQT